MIFEDVTPLTPVLIEERNRRTKENWIQIGVEYLDKKQGGWTQARYAKEAKIPLSTLQKALSRYKEEIKAEYARQSKASKKKKGPLSKAEQKRRMINSFRSQLKSRLADAGAAINNKSERWFKDTIRKSIRGKSVTKPIPGKMYTFIYDAKYKDTLPYWDKYPLIIYLGNWSAKNGNRLMQGLNLHYIPPRARQEMLEDLLVHSNTSTITSKTRLNINWNTVKNMNGSSEMIKNYLPGHIKGQLIEIEPKDWVNVIWMPSQQMISKGKRYSARKVWTNSMR